MAVASTAKKIVSKEVMMSLCVDLKLVKENIGFSNSLHSTWLHPSASHMRGIFRVCRTECSSKKEKFSKAKSCILSLPPHISMQKHSHSSGCRCGRCFFSMPQMAWLRGGGDYWCLGRPVWERAVYCRLLDSVLPRPHSVPFPVSVRPSHTPYGK